MEIKNPALSDLLQLGASLVGGLTSQRGAVSGFARTQAKRAADRFGLVERDEFEAALAMIAKARQIQVELDARMKIIESKLKIAPKKAAAPKKKATKAPARRLPSVKHDKKKRAKKA